jgi:cell division septum initiation protein DivIVA
MITPELREAAQYLLQHAHHQRAVLAIAETIRDGAELEDHLKVLEQRKQDAEDRLAEIDETAKAVQQRAVEADEERIVAQNKAVKIVNEAHADAEDIIDKANAGAEQIIEAANIKADIIKRKAEDEAKELTARFDHVRAELVEVSGLVLAKQGELEVLDKKIAKARKFLDDLAKK